MKTIMPFAATAALALYVIGAPAPALARDEGAIAAGVVGGLLLGGIAAQQERRSYYSGPSYYEEPRHYRSYDSGCRTVRQEFEDRRGNLRVRRVRVCD